MLNAPAAEQDLAEVAGLPGDSVDEVLAEALASALLIEVREGVYGFRHALARQAVEDAVPSPVRRRLHLRAAQVLERRAREAARPPGPPLPGRRPHEGVDPLRRGRRRPRHLARGRRHRVPLPQGGRRRPGPARGDAGAARGQARHARALLPGARRGDRDPPPCAAEESLSPRRTRRGPALARPPADPGRRERDRLHGDDACAARPQPPAGAGGRGDGAAGHAVADGRRRAARGAVRLARPGRQHGGPHPRSGP